VKRLIELFVSMAFWAVSGLWDLICRMAGSEARQTCVVLYYHRVPAQYRTRFARQMDMLLRLAKPIGPDRRSPSSTARRRAMVTFDDGYESTVEIGLPELKKRGIPATVFVIVKALGGLPDWQSFSAGRDASDKVISVEKLRALDPDAVTIGSHTLTHPLLPSLDEKEAWHEIADSRAMLESILGREVKFFSFPYGAFNESLVDLCRRAQYQRVFTTLPVLADINLGEFATGRVSVEPTDWPLEFRLKLLGAYRWLPAAFWLKRKLLSFRVRGSKQQRATEVVPDRCTSPRA